MTATVVMLAALIVAAGVMWRRGARGVAVLLAGLALLPGYVLVQRLSWPAIVLVLVVVGLAVWLRSGRTAATVTRWGARARRKAGVASPSDVLRGASAPVMRARAGTVRPSLA